MKQCWIKPNSLLANRETQKNPGAKANKNTNPSERTSAGSQNNSGVARERNREDRPLKASIQTYEDMMDDNLEQAEYQPVERKKAQPKKKEFLKRKREITSIPVETKKYNYYADNFDSQKNDENNDTKHGRSEALSKPRPSTSRNLDDRELKPAVSHQKQMIGNMKNKPMKQEAKSSAQRVYSKQNSFQHSDYIERSNDDDGYNSVEEFEKLEEECIKEITNKNDKNTHKQKAKNQQPKVQNKNRKLFDNSESSESDEDSAPEVKPQANSQGNMSNVVK